MCKTHNLGFGFLTARVSTEILKEISVLLEHVFPSRVLIIVISFLEETSYRINVLHSSKLYNCQQNFSDTLFSYK
jgi:hypothetical protein